MFMTKPMKRKIDMRTMSLRRLVSLYMIDCNMSVVNRMYFSDLGYVRVNAV